MSNYCEACDVMYNFDLDKCPGCPSDALRILTGDFYGLACSVLREHEEGSYAAQAFNLAAAMKLCYEMGVANSNSSADRKLISQAVWSAMGRVK